MSNRCLLVVKHIGYSPYTSLHVIRGALLDMLNVKLIFKIDRCVKVVNSSKFERASQPTVALFVCETLRR